jgi:hypothetical protein
LPHYFEWTWQTIRSVRWLGLATEVKLPNKELIEAKMGDYYGAAIITLTKVAQGVG